MDTSKDQLPITGDGLCEKTNFEYSHNISTLFLDPRFEELLATGRQVYMCMQWYAEESRSATSRIVRLSNYCKKFFSITAPNSNQDSNIEL